MDKGKLKKIICIVLCAAVAVLWYTGEERQKDIEEYNINASSTATIVYSFCDNALGIYDEEPTTFSELNDSHTAVQIHIWRWTAWSYSEHKLKGDLPFRNGEDGDEVLIIAEDISTLNSDLMNAYFLKNPEKNEELTKEEVTKRVEDIRRRTDILCAPFPE